MLWLHIAWQGGYLAESVSQAKKGSARECLLVWCCFDMDDIDLVLSARFYDWNSGASSLARS